MANPFEVTFADPVMGSLEVERKLSDLATAREARAEQALRQQAVGLNIAEFQANAPLREAERQKKLGDYQYADQLAREGIDIAPAAAPRAAPQVPGGQPVEGGLPSWLTGRESGGNFGAVNADTGAAGRGQFMESRLADAKRAGVVPANMTLDQFRADSTAQVRVEQWHVSDIGNFITRNQLDQYVGRTVAGIPITPNGMLAVAHLGGSAGLKKFLETGGQYNPADANGTRLSDYMLLGARAQGVMPQAQARPAAQLPAGALGEGFLRSPAGVPMTVSEADLPPTTGAQAQAGLGQSGTAQTPSGATVQVPGVPGAPPVVDSAGFFPGTEPIPGGWQMIGPLEALQQGALALRTSTPRSPPVAPTPVATTGGAMYAAPSQLTLGGATAIVPAGLSPAMGGGTPLGGAISPVPLAGQRQGLLPTPAQAAAAAAARQQQQQAQPVGLGLEYSAPAQRMQQQIARERALLQQELASVRLLAPGKEQRDEVSRIRRAYQALADKETDIQADLAAGGLLAGQAGLANQLLSSNNLYAQPRITNGRFTGYDVLRNGAVVQSNMSPEKLAAAVRDSYNADARRQAQERAKATYETQLEVFKDRAKQLGVATTEIAKIEAQARTRGYSQVTKVGEEELILTNPTTMEAVRYSFVPVPGSKPPRRELVVEQVRANVPVQ